MELAPIVLFVYNRPQHTLKVLEALRNDHLASQSILYIFADGPKPEASYEELEKIRATRAVIESRNWCKEVYIHAQDENIGLAASILGGIGNTIEKYGRVIVLEDDVIISPYFLTYMNEALELYKNDEKVMHISSFVPVRQGMEQLPDTYFLPCMSCWGWATWTRAWQQNINDSKWLYQRLKKNKQFKRFDMDNSLGMVQLLILNIEKKHNTWAANWYASIFLQDGLCLYPKQSLSAQIGLDASGMHCGDDTLGFFKVNLAQNIHVYRNDITINPYAYRYFKRFLRYGNFTGYQAFRQRLRGIKTRTINKFNRFYKTYITSTLPKN